MRYPVAMLAVVMTGCTKGTYLAPLDQQLIVGAERADIAIVLRQDGGMPSADRALARSACGNLARVLADSQLDAGVVCPP